MWEKRKISLTLSEVQWIQEQLVDHYFVGNIREVLRLLTSKVPSTDENELN